MTPLLGLAIVLAAGALNGSYALPTKHTPRWNFENTWLVYSFVGMLCLSWGVALATVPDLANVYLAAGWRPVLMIFAFGVVWGVGNLLFGAGLYLIGISLTFPICIGLSTALGALIPMARDPAVFLTPSGIAITLGVAVLLGGVLLCAVAGARLNAQSATAIADAPSNSPGRSRLATGLLVVTLSGLCDPCLNFAFAFGDRVKEEAVRAGAGLGSESDAIWALALTGSFVVNAAYCVRLLCRNQSWSRFRASGVGGYWAKASLMAVLWMGSITLYGRGASLMGPLGGSAGWAVFYCAIIIFATFWGIVAGEWREGGGRPLRTLFAGLAVLSLAILILGYGNSLAVDSAP